jgi:AcrR family transcriptional regulator
VLSEFFGAERNNSIRKLVIAAIECFAERGYRATTTRDIAKRAQMSPAALYVHFRSKNEHDPAFADHAGANLNLFRKRAT